MREGAEKASGTIISLPLKEIAFFLLSPLVRSALGASANP
jgi:hypothetical protein